ncbi:MAG: flavocytochrome c [Psychrilyobacter sp.]|uniref:flavocytochrome c n=1 Tax=Psychrilyobacter sp. TaxID=2586924 RepID=UPI003C70D5E5
MKIYKNGSFKGVGIGYGGEIEALIIVVQGKIKSIEFLSHNETPVISEPAFNHVPSNIIEKNTIMVPNVKGCSMSSRGIREAVMNALILSGENKEELLKEFKNSENLDKIVVSKNKLKFKPVENFDIVIIGGGGAGLSAAISASNLGAKVVLLEKMAAVGGNTLVSMGGINIPGSDAQQSKKIEDSPELYYNDALVGGDGENNKKLFKILSENALDTYKWLKEEIGVEFKKDELIHFGGHTVPRAAVFKGKYAVELISKLRKKAENLGVDIRTGVEAKEIITKDEKVVGIKALTEGKTVEFFGSKGVIFATGGFSGNIEMRKKYNPELDERYKTTNQSGITGDGHLMCEKLGVDFVHMSYIQTFPIANPITGALSHVGGSRFDGAILVNKSGKRFVEELERRDVVSQAILAQEGGIGYLVWAQEVEAIANRTTDNKAEVNSLIRSDLFIEGDIEECSQKMDINLATLKVTLNIYNSNVENGKDQEFDRRGNLINIEKGPFYVQTVAPAVHHTMGGIKINSNNEVLDVKGNIIKGLYAAGEIVGGIHGTNRLGGNAITDILVFGKRTGEKIME